jgi:hypothetical protein
MPFVLLVGPRITSKNLSESGNIIAQILGMSDPFRVLRPAPMDRKGVYNRSSHVHAAASGLLLPLPRRLSRVLAQAAGGTATAGAPIFSGNEMRVPLTSSADEQIVTIRVSYVNISSGLDDVDFDFLIADAMPAARSTALT